MSAEIECNACLSERQVFFVFSLSADLVIFYLFIFYGIHTLADMKSPYRLCLYSFHGSDEKHTSVSLVFQALRHNNPVELPKILLLQELLCFHFLL